MVSIGNERAYVPPPHDLNRVFELFPCLDSREAQTASGQGLGPYIAKKLMDSQGARFGQKVRWDAACASVSACLWLEVKSGRENPDH